MIHQRITSIVSLAFAFMLAAMSHVRASDCTMTSVGLTPIGDLGTGLYLGQFEGGHYPGGSNIPPPAHHTAGLLRVAAVQPRDTSGALNPSGKIVLMSIGMSNATQEFCSPGNLPPCNAWTFMGRAAVHPSVNHTTLTIINGARGGQTPPNWDNPSDVNYDLTRDNWLTPNGLTEAQVQVIWIKEADAGPTISLPNANADAYTLETGLANVIRAAKVRYPNLQIVFASNRIYAGYASTTLNPEPYAYESGFAVKWLVQAQIDQMANGGVVVDAHAGDLNCNTGAPWIAWGPDLWADGTTPRSDGLLYQCADIEADGTHPAQPAENKVGFLLMNFMLRSPYAYPWFSICQPGDVNGDGLVNGADVQRFVEVVLNPPGGTAQERCASDANTNGLVTTDDTPGFVTLLLIQ